MNSVGKALFYLIGNSRGAVFNNLDAGTDRIAILIESGEF
jgi:hypothetical protein